MTYTLTQTGASSTAPLNTLYKKLYTKRADAISFEFPLFKKLKSMKHIGINSLSNEMIIPFDTRVGGGVASVGEDSYLANPSTPGLKQLYAGYRIFNKRFPITLVSKLMDKKARAAQHEQIMKWSVLKATQALGHDFCGRLVNSETGVIGVFAEDVVASQDCVAGNLTAPIVKDGKSYGCFIDVAFLGGADWRGGSGSNAPGHARDLARHLLPGDYIALVNTAASGGPALERADAVREILAVYPNTTTAAATNVVETGSPSLAVSAVRVVLSGTWGVTAPVAATKTMVVVKANAAANLSNPTVADTDFNRGLTGIMDWTNDDPDFAVHGMTPTSEPAWGIAGVRTGGRLTGLDLKRAAQEITYESPLTGNSILWSPGLARDLAANQEKNVRYNSPIGLELMTTVKAQGITIEADRFVPTGECLVLNWDALGKVDVQSDVPSVGEGDLQKVENRPIYIGDLTMVYGTVVKNRKAIYHFRNMLEDNNA